MDVIIVFVLLIVAVAVLFKRPIPINITITHKIEQQSAPIPQNPTEDKEMKEAVADVASILQNIMMGGENNDRK